MSRFFLADGDSIPSIRHSMNCRFLDVKKGTNVGGAP